MTVLNQLAHAQGRRDEVPNQELAKELAETKNEAGIQEIIAGLTNKDKNVQNDCIKVIYEIGYIDPDLISAYAADFLALLCSKNNRLVWGSMLALSTIAERQANELFERRDQILNAVEKGSVITQDNGIRVLATIAAQQPDYRAELLPTLLNHLKTCRPKDVPQRAEKIVLAVAADNKQQFIDIIQKRMVDMKPSQAKRLEKVVREAEKR